MELVKYTNLNDRYGYVLLVPRKDYFSYDIELDGGSWWSTSYNIKDTGFAFFLSRLGRYGCRYIGKEDNTLVFYYVYVDYSTQHSKTEELKKVFKDLIEWN